MLRSSPPAAQRPRVVLQDRVARGARRRAQVQLQVQRQVQAQVQLQVQRQVQAQVQLQATCTGAGTGAAQAVGSTPATVNGGTNPDSIPLALRWYRASAEAHALFVQSYCNATAAAQMLAAAQAGKPWGVIMDADETVLDNSMYQQSRGGRGYTAGTWEAWVRSMKATPIPGAADFINRVRALGGKVSIVTNREANVCLETEANLRAIGLNVDQVLCKASTATDKNPRFAAVQSGIAPSVVSQKSHGSQRRLLPQGCVPLARLAPPQNSRAALAHGTSATLH